MVFGLLLGVGFLRMSRVGVKMVDVGNGRYICVSIDCWVGVDIVVNDSIDRIYLY